MFPIANGFVFDGLQQISIIFQFYTLQIINDVTPARTCRLNAFKTYPRLSILIIVSTLQQKLLLYFSACKVRRRQNILWQGIKQYYQNASLRKFWTLSVYAVLSCSAGNKPDTECRIKAYWNLFPYILYTLYFL